MNLGTSRARLWTGRKVSIGEENARVMVVDDNRSGAEALAMYLHLEDFEIKTAYGGKEAIQVAMVWMPHLIVMDISMPECNGYEAALLLRKNVQTRNIAIIACTALDETEVRRHLQDHEFDAYCQKGQPPNQLVALIKQMWISKAPERH